MKTHLFYLIIAGFALMVGCERDKDLILVEATVEILNYDGNALIQEPGGTVDIDAQMQSIAGIEKVEILLDGTVAENIVLEQPLAYSHLFTYTIPSEASIGTEYSIVFKMTDAIGRVTESQVVKIIADQPYSVEEFVFEGTTYQRIKGRVNEDLTLTNDQSWLIDSIVAIDEGAVLAIEAGTTVYFRAYDNTTVSTLSINRGSRIQAIGTRTQPIVFTSSKVNGGSPAPGDWGGLMLHGHAPTNAGSTVLYDGFRYGGTRPTDNSGSLRFVRIEYAGKRSLHALQLFGIGSGTSVEYIQTYRSYNHAYRVRGGRVSLRYIAGIHHGGYGIWADEGWQGNGQFWLFQTAVAATLTPVNYWNQARSIEFRNHDTDFSRQPRTTFRLSNITLIGNGNQVADGTRRGIRIRTGSQGFMYNTIVTQFPSDGVRSEDLPAGEYGVSTILDRIRSYGNATNWGEYAVILRNSGNYDLSEAPVPGISLGNFRGIVASSYNPTAMSSWFVSAPYIGAVDPANDWTSGGVWFRN